MYSFSNTVNDITNMMFFVSMIPFVLFVILTVFRISKRFNKSGTFVHVTPENITLEFDMLYNSLYKNNFTELEKMRKKVRWQKIISNLSFVAFVVSYFLLELHQSIKFDNVLVSFAPIIAVVSAILFFVFLIIWFKSNREYAIVYKKEIVKNFINLLNDKLIYKSDVSAKPFEVQYKIANFDNKVHNRFYVDDYIKGLLDEQTFIQMADLLVQYHHSGKNSYTETIFNGLFAQTRSNKDIGTTIKISADKFFKNNSRVQMDSQEFEKYFDIYCDDKILAMQLLTSDTMECLVDFYNKHYIQYEIVLRNDTIYMRFFTGAMFEPKTFGSSMDKEVLFKYYSILKFVLEVTTKINKTLQDLDI